MPEIRIEKEDGYDIYEEGVEKGYFCKREDGSDFIAAVWPGWTHFPDFLNAEAREWFGSKYARLMELGIDGFWNDMNEPAIFYSKEGIEALRSFLISIGMPKNFEELGAKEEDIEKLAYTCCYGKGNEGGRIGGFVSLEQKDVEAIYKLML